MTGQRLAVALFLLNARTCFAGCCYSFGYGDMMKPCCLKTSSAGREECSTGARFGGATGFTEGTCPASAEAADEAFKAGLKASSPSSPSGCCFAIGYGAMMKPCCLSTRAEVKKETCGGSDKDMVGGNSGFKLGSFRLLRKKLTASCRDNASLLIRAWL